MADNELTTKDPELAARMYLARNHLERLRGRDVTLDELGQLVADCLPERGGKAFGGSVIARWLKAQQEPENRATWRALASVLDVDPGWLTYGTGRMEIEPPLTPADIPPEGHRPGDPAPRPTPPAHRGEAPARKRGKRR